MSATPRTAELHWRPAGSAADLTRLTPEETAHVAAIAPGRARDAQAVSYALRREVLGPVRITRRCAACGSAEHGRPAVAGGPSFSVSRAAGGAAIAVLRGAEIGLDVAAAQPQATWDELAPRMRAPQDTAMAPQRAWTGKEAVLKLLGHGLALPMAEVRLEAGGAWGVSALDAAGVLQWVELDDGVLAAVATHEAVTVVIRSAGTSARRPRPGTRSPRAGRRSA